MSQELTKVTQQIEVAGKIDEVVKHVMDNSKSSGFVKAYVQADAIEKISQYLDDNYMKPILSLKNKRIGFLTDEKTGDPYKMEIIRDCVIEATLTGLQVTGNQFNIIAGRMYVTKEGFTELLSSIPGLWKNFIYDVPKITGERAIVDVTIQWKKPNEEKKEQKLSFPLRINKASTDDNMLGKAERKAKKWLYYEITGNDLGEGEAPITQDIDHEVISGDNNVVINITTDLRTEFNEEEKRALTFLEAAVEKKDKDYLGKVINSVKQNVISLNIDKYVEIYNKM